MVTLTLDTSELVAVLRARGRDERFGYDHAAMREIPRVVSVIVVQELVHGAASSGRSFQRRAQLDRLLSELPTVDFTREDAEASGELAARLRQVGTPIGDLDILIAGQALARGWTVVTRNVKHFGRVEGLPIIDWSVGFEPLSYEMIAVRIAAAT